MAGKLVRFGLAVIAGLIGTAVVVTPAHAAVGACNNGHPIVSPCINFGDSSYTHVRADFYLNVNPSSTYYSYDVVVYDAPGQNPFNVKYMATKQRLTVRGRYCPAPSCWLRHVDNLPNISHQSYTYVAIYNSAGAQVSFASSPRIYYMA